MAEVSVKSFTLFTWLRVFENCSQVCYLTGSLKRGNDPEFIFSPEVFLAVCALLTHMSL